MIYLEDRFIVWNKVEVVGWPESVLFYCHECWSKSDCRILKSRIDEIEFTPTASENQLPAPSEAEKTEIREKVESFLLKYFNITKFNWTLVKVHLAAFHLSHPRDWSGKDVRVIKQMLDHFAKLDYSVPGKRCREIIGDEEVK